MGRKILHIGCKKKGCDRKHTGKGYCKMHYTRQYLGMHLIKTCAGCGIDIEHYKNNQQYCNKCLKKIARKRADEKNEFYKKNYVNIPLFSSSTKGKTKRVYTNGATERMKPLIRKIRDTVLNKCIKNPSEFLYEKKKKNEQQMP